MFKSKDQILVLLMDQEMDLMAAVVLCLAQTYDTCCHCTYVIKSESDNKDLQCGGRGSIPCILVETWQLVDSYLKPSRPKPA